MEFENSYVHVILVVNNASLLSLTAMILRSELEHLTFVYDILTSIYLFLYLQFVYSFKYCSTLHFFFALIPFSAFFFTKLSYVL